jgi:hypothetical protein
LPDTWATGPKEVKHNTVENSAVYLHEICAQMAEKAGFFDLARAIRKSHAEGSASPRREHEPSYDEGPDLSVGNAHAAPPAMHEHGAAHAAQAESSGGGHGGAQAEAESGGYSGGSSRSGDHGGSSADADHGHGAGHGGNSHSRGHEGSDHSDDAHAVHASAHVDPHGHTPAHIDVHVHDLHADPFAGLHSARLKEGLQRDAFRTASADAQDSSIHAAASAIQRAAVETLSTPPPGFKLDTSPGAQSARIAALGDERPPGVEPPSRDAAALTRPEPDSTSREMPAARIPERSRDSDFER